MFSAPETAGRIVKKEILLDSVPLSSLRISDRERYLLMSTIDHYVSIKKNRDIDIVETRVEDMIKGIGSSPIYQEIKKKIFNTPDDVKEFERWYKMKAADILQKEVLQVTVNEKGYILDSDLSSVKLVSNVRVGSF